MKTLSVIILAILFGSGCKKYPDDAMLLHLRKPEKRILGHWSLENVINTTNNHPVLIAPCHDHFRFSTDLFEGMTSGPTYWTKYFNYNGNWELFDHKKNLRITEQNNNILHEFTILRLEKSHFVLQADSLQFTFKDYCGP